MSKTFHLHASFDTTVKLSSEEVASFVEYAMEYQHPADPFQCYLRELLDKRGVEAMCRAVVVRVIQDMVRGGVSQLVNADMRIKTAPVRVIPQKTGRCGICR